MARSSNQKLKLLHLLQIFSQQTDEAHPLTLQQLQEQLAARGVSAERKSLYDDMDALRSFGFDIMVNRGRTTGYYMGSRDFQLPELKLLVDSVQSSKFITEKKTLELIKKIEGLASVYDAQLLQRQVYVRGRVKSMNESVYYSVDEISAAIAQDRMLSFQYFRYDLNKQRQLRHDGAQYAVSPFALMWDHENYYLLAYDADAGVLKHYRVDRMTALHQLPEKRQGAEAFAAVDMSSYTKKIFGMFTGEEQQVKLRFENRLVDVVLDRFGKDVMIIPDGDGHFTVNISVAVSEQFYGWLLGFGTSAELVAPAAVRSDFAKRLQAVSAMYE
ncbi:MAG: WYL domain-containing protein [Oscillospiraceae bacterium]|nr:WYL domain-containing protein [Oscillospiraceae bacterium]